MSHNGPKLTLYASPSSIFYELCSRKSSILLAHSLHSFFLLQLLSVKTANLHQQFHLYLFLSHSNHKWSMIYYQTQQYIILNVCYLTFRKRYLILIIYLLTILVTANIHTITSSLLTTLLSLLH